MRRIRIQRTRRPRARAAPADVREPVSQTRGALAGARLRRRLGEMLAEIDRALRDAA